VLFDRLEVVAGAPAVLQMAGVDGRCEVVGGDFFVAVPPDGDAYLLRQIIHDWREKQAIQILRNCRAAIRPGGRLLVIERAVAADPREALAVLHADLEMMVGVGGSERTDAEYAALFAQAGFRLSSVVPLRNAAQFSIFEGMPA
jgi:O-methyltransferase